jgi:hypothetical protein
MEFTVLVLCFDGWVRVTLWLNMRVPYLLCSPHGGAAFRVMGWNTLIGHISTPSGLETFLGTGGRILGRNALWNTTFYSCVLIALDLDSKFGAASNSFPLSSQDSICFLNYTFRR